MLIEVKVPQLSESVAEATLVSWHKQVGEAVARDENLIDIETDKVVLETPAPDAGVLVAIIKQNGASVTSGELIAQIEAMSADAHLFDAKVKVLGEFIDKTAPRDIDADCLDALKPNPPFAGYHGWEP